MAIAEMFFWWYSSGWRIFIHKVLNCLASITDFFSMDSLIRTLFKPFRQISADTASGTASLDVKFHMFLDRLVSRFIGFISRLILLLAGTLIIIIGGIFSLIFIIIWPIIPLLPIVGVVLSITGLII